MILPVIIISLDDKFREKTRELLTGSDRVQVIGEFDNFNSSFEEKNLNKIGNIQSPIVVVDVSSVQQQGFQTIAETISQFKDSYVFVAGDRADKSLVLGCMRAGAKEFLSHPIESSQLFSALERVRKVIGSRPHSL